MSGPRACQLVLALLCAAALAGCGQALSVGADRTLRLSLNEYRLNPQDVRASPGTLTIVVRNHGRLTHNLVISRDGQPAAVSNPIPPGGVAEFSLVLTPGKYSMASTMFSDQALGTYGTLSVS